MALGKEKHNEQHDGKPRGRGGRLLGRGLRGSRGGPVFPPRGGRGGFKPPKDLNFSFTSPPKSKKDDSDSEPENEADNA